MPALARCLALLLSHGAHDGAGATGYVADAAAAPAPASAFAPPREAILISVLRQEDSMARFWDAVTAAGLAPQDVTAELLGRTPAATDSEALAADSEDDEAAAAGRAARLLPGAVRWLHLPRGCMQRRWLRAVRLRPPQM